MINNLFMSLFTVSTIVAVILSTFKRKTTPTKNKRIAWILVAVFFVIAVTTMPPVEEKTGEKPKPTPTITKTITPKPIIDPLDSWKKYRVNWNEYGSQLRVIIANDYRNRDCQSLQDTFDLAVYTNPEHSAEYGHNNAKLMQYIDHLLQAANCYK
jgi:hypothetical protein